LPKNKRVFVIIPVYGYEPLLLQLLQNIPSSIDRIYLIWDMPDDHQYQKIKAIVDERIQLVIRKSRGGIGFAMQLGVQLSLNELDGDPGILVLMAGNGKDLPSELERMIRPIDLDQADYVQGSRYLEGGHSINLPVPRKIINKVLPLLWSIVLRKRVTEVTNGFRAFSADVFRGNDLIWRRKDLGGYEWEYYINYQLITGNFVHREVPVTKKYLRNVNHSKIKLSDGYQILRPLILCPLGKL